MCAMCGSASRHGQQQPEQIARDKAKLERVRAKMAKRAEENSN